MSRELERTLHGEDPRRTAGLAVAVGGLWVALAVVLDVGPSAGVGVLDAEQLLVLALVVGVLGAALWARWNGGYVGSLVVVFGCVGPWLASVTLGLAIAVLASVVGGTVGHAIGRWAVAREGSSPGHLRLTGWRWHLLALGLGAAATLAVLVTPPAARPMSSGFVGVFRPIGLLSFSAVAGWGALLGWTVLAALPAPRGAGITASWAVVGLPLLGANYVAFATVGPGSSPLAFALLVGGAYAAVLGTAGYVLATAISVAVSHPGYFDVL